MKRYNRHIFICENVRSEDHPRGSCGPKGGGAVKEAFKQKLKTMGLNASVRANTAGCLDACEHGVTVVVYPEQVWYGGVTTADVDEIINSHIINGTPVERLMIKDKKFNRDAGEN